MMKTRVTIFTLGKNLQHNFDTDIFVTIPHPVSLPQIPNSETQTLYTQSIIASPASGSVDFFASLTCYSTTPNQLLFLRP